MIRAVIWDIDGTLIDSEPTHLRALQAVCELYDVDISDLPDDCFTGVNLLGVWDVLKPRFPTDLAMPVWIERLNCAYLQSAQGLAVIPGAVFVIDQLARQGIRQAAVSNSHRVVVDANLALLDIAVPLEFSLSLDDVAEGKPSPVPYLAALERLGLSPGEALAVEDSRTGVRSAQSAGMTVIGFGPLPLGADHSVSHLSDILDFIAAG